jgi:hypothetical protein
MGDSKLLDRRYGDVFKLEAPLLAQLVAVNIVAGRLGVPEAKLGK